MGAVTDWDDSDYKYHKPLFDRADERKRERIVKAATKEFASHGFETANINRIAEKASVSVGSLYKYFGTKKNLFQYIVRSGLFKLQEVLASIENQPNAPLMIRIEKILRAILETSKANSDMIRLYLEISATGKRSNAKVLASDIETPSSKVYTEIISEAQARGEIRSDIDPGTAAFLIDNIFISLQFSCVSDYYSERCRIFTGSGMYDDEKIIAQTMVFLRNALGISEQKKHGKGKTDG